MSGKIFAVYIIILISIFTSTAFTQHQITVKPSLGLYIYNSENSLKIMGDQNYLLNYGFEVSYENKDLFGYDIQLDYSYSYSDFEDVLKFVYTGESSPDPLGSFYSDVSLSLHTFDVSLKNEISGYFSYGFGPSFSFVNRSYIIAHYDFEDRLASFAVGVSGSIDVKLPLDENTNYWYFYSGIKFRYLYGLFYDEGLRDLSNYNQHFVTGNLTIGIGYSF
jgi:hypothetical protein